MTGYGKVAQLKTVGQFRARVEELRLDGRLPADDTMLSAADGSPLAEPLAIGPLRAGNRWCIHPMEGWDAEPDGSPSPLTLRRWRLFGLSGAKLIWGGEAAAVREDGRANPRQTLATAANLDGLRRLRQSLLDAHREQGLDTDDLLIGLQLTHSGRFCRPHGSRFEPRIAYHHPQLDEKFGIDPQDDSVLLSDDDLETLIDCYVAGATTARDAGFVFVDIKACHGYLMHELLSGRRRPGRFGGDLEGRSRMLRTIVGRVRSELPELEVGVRLSVFDVPPYRSGRDVGRPMAFDVPYEDGFGVDRQDPLQTDLDEPLRLIGWLEELGVAAINVSCGSPYYCPHVQRPAIFPPSDGYQPPEDPLAGVARQIDAARQCKAAFPELPMIGTGYSYLQDYLPHVAQAVVRRGWIDSVGLGRMVLSYPQLPLDVLRGEPLKRRRVCRTFSDCTTAPRNGLVSGCYPLDDFYKSLPEAQTLRQLKQADKQ